MPKYDVRILTEPDYPQWDHLVEQSVQGSIFHSSGWITAAAKLRNVNVTIIGVFDTADLIGGCFLYIRNPFPGYTIGYTINKVSPYGGFVISNPTGVHVRGSETREHEIIALVLKKIQTLNLARTTIINGPGLVDIRPFTRLGWRERVYYTYILSLEDDTFLTISYGARRNIRKAQKLGITITKEYNPDIFWKLAIATYEKQKMNVPYKKEPLFTFMEMLIHNGLGDMWIAKTSSGEPASAVFYTYDSHMAHGLLGVNDPRFRDTGAVSLILYETIRDLQNRGFHWFNIMAANTPHLAQFYSGFNPRLVPYYGVEKVNVLGKLINIFR